MNFDIDDEFGTFRRRGIAEPIEFYSQSSSSSEKVIVIRLKTVCDRVFGVAASPVRQSGTAYLSTSRHRYAVGLRKTLEDASGLFGLSFNT